LRCLNNGNNVFQFLVPFHSLQIGKSLISLSLSDGNGKHMFSFFAAHSFALEYPFLHSVNGFLCRDNGELQQKKKLHPVHWMVEKRTICRSLFSIYTNRTMLHI
jgi:hypothetical protein